MSLGQAGLYSDEAFNEGWIGTGWMQTVDLTQRLHESNAEFRQEFIPIVIETNQLDTKIAAGLACSATWVVAKQMNRGDIVLSPNGKGGYLVGKILGDYYFASGGNLPHRRPVEWLDRVIDKSELSNQLRGSIATNGTVVWLNGYPDDIQKAYEDELNSLISASSVVTHATEALDENVSFVMEKYLESFLVSNWDKTILAAEWELVGSQVPTETGPLDILAKSKDSKQLLVIELKLRHATDDVLGQVQRYMGWVQSQAEPGQTVRGLIIGIEMDKKLKWALEVAPNISFMRYEMDFRLLN